MAIAVTGDQLKLCLSFVFAQMKILSRGDVGQDKNRKCAIVKEIQKFKISLKLKINEKNRLEVADSGDWRFACELPRPLSYLRGKEAAASQALYMDHLPACLQRR